MTRPGASPPDDPASYGCHVFAAPDLLVVAGANLGDALGRLDTLCPGDVYALQPGAEGRHLLVREEDGQARSVMADSGEGPRVAGDSEVGRPGESISLDGRLTLIGGEGALVELLLISVAGDSGRPFFLPLAPIEPRQPYTLIRAEADPGPVRLADITPVAFTRGTLITLAGGRQRAVEALVPGDRLLTRDHGAQPLRWVGRRTMRAIGPCAPVVIGAGTLGNAGDLIVGQHQRLFLYRRGRDRLAETSEVLVKAVHLVEGARVTLRAGGFVEYFHLVLDRHEIIYAEGVPTESLPVTARMLRRLPADLASEVSSRLPDLAQRPHFATEADPGTLRARLAAALHRRGRTL